MTKRVDNIKKEIPIKKIWIYLTLLVSLNSLALEQTHFKARKFDSPEREQSIIVSSEGYYPKVVHVYSGEKVKFFITSTGSRPSCFTIPKKQVFLPASRGEISESTVFFERPGVYEFNCPAGGIKGRIVVQEHPTARRARIKREIASEKRVKIWRPRDE
ncbi:hypothetical protein A9Q84_18230 [Halobacteriovorax marinus]|uniref:EfeO-type cupredoxin-like domain-containing protein n=1 Tax=Halobacteriovorax marinus TaxID=97084 RepID=A0A1Y5F2Z8_9BACT|nr:hypothetical protein A9Q84_18230 [Halobacteriovorax marinus]